MGSMQALRKLNDPRLDVAFAAAVLDAGLEGKPLLQQIEELIAKEQRAAGKGIS